MPDLFYLQPLLLLASILGWIGFSRFAKRKGYSAAIAHGCGFIVGCVCFFVLGSLYFVLRPAQGRTEFPNKLSEIKPGMIFDLKTEGVFACSSADRLAEYVLWEEEKNEVAVKSLMQGERAIGACFARSLIGYRYVVVEVGTAPRVKGTTVGFRSLNAPIPMTLYTPIRFIEPSTLSIPPDPYQSVPRIAAATSSGSSNLDLKAGMLFVLNPATPFACQSPKQLAATPMFSSTGNQADADKYFSTLSCHTNASTTEAMTVDTVQYEDGLESAVVGFHIGDNENRNAEFTMADFITPLISPVSDEPYQNTPHVVAYKSGDSTISPLKPGQVFYLNSKTPFACSGVGSIGKLYFYASNGDLENFNRMLVMGGEKAGCYGHLPTDVQWTVDDVDTITSKIKKGIYIKNDVVKFHPTSVPRVTESYFTLPEFITTSPAPTPSAAN